MQFLTKIENGAVVGRPLLLSNVIQTNDSVASIDKDFLLSSDLLPMAYGVFIYTTPEVNIDLTKEYKEVTATEQDSDGNWLQKFVLEDIEFDTPEAKQAVIDSMLVSKAASVRAERDSLIKATDFYALSDVVMTTEMTAYRQALRAVPEQEGFPNTITWPTAP